MINTIIVHDFETGSVNPWKTQPLQWAGLALDGRTFKIMDVFEIKIRPFFDDFEEYGLDEIQQGALDVNGLTVEELEEAPSPKEAFNSIQQWVESVSPKGTGAWSGPVRVGFNNLKFDDIIMDRLMVGHWPISNKITGVPEGKKEPYKFGKLKTSKYTGEKEQNLFNFKQLDIHQLMMFWMDGVKRDSKSNSMDAFREYFGLSKLNAHDAKTDVYDEAALMVRFMEYMRANIKKTNFNNAFGGISGEEWLKK